MDTGRVMEAASKSMVLMVTKEATIKLETFIPIAITTAQLHAQASVSLSTAGEIIE